jgi:hypothetical protein
MMTNGSLRTCHYPTEIIRYFGLELQLTYYTLKKNVKYKLLFLQKQTKNS